MKRLVAVAVLALMVDATAVGASPILVSVSGVVIGGDPSTKTLYIADSQGRVSLILARRFVAVGAVVRVRGERSTPSWTVLAAGSVGHLTRIGNARRVLVRGELGFVDIAK